MERLFGGGNQADKDDDDSIDPKVIDADLRDGIAKELRRSDISDEDRKEYEEALKKLDSENSQDTGSGA